MADWLVVVMAELWVALLVASWADMMVDLSVEKSVVKWVD